MSRIQPFSQNENSLVHFTHWSKINKTLHRVLLLVGEAIDAVTVSRAHLAVAVALQRSQTPAELSSEQL